MRDYAYILCAILMCSLLGLGQSSECPSVRRAGDEVTWAANSWDPVMVLGRELADSYGIAVSVEDPKWAFPIDAEDVAIADPKFSTEHHNAHYLVIKPHVIQIRFFAPRNEKPQDISGLLRQIVDVANQEMPYAYRLDVSGTDYALVPTKTRNSAGQLEDIQPMLDRHVTIPAGTRAIAEHAELMANQLSQQTGLHVSCCQSMVAGIPLGLGKVAFEAHDKLAREVLRELLRLEDEANGESPNKHPAFNHWTLRCDATGAPWCFIEAEGNFSNRCNWFH